LADNGDNPLGELLASSLRGPYPSPSRNPKEIPPLSLKLPARAHGLRVEGDSMAPEFKAGDYVVVDPDAPAEPGDIVVTKLDRGNAATLRKYHTRGEDADGHPVFELVPQNADYPTLTVDATNPGRLIAPVFEHHRKLRRGG
jgi:SOS-response transcriptional repressor LexA